MTAPSHDRFDEMRRAWIAAHLGASTIQRRRAEILGRTGPGASTSGRDRRPRPARRHRHPAAVAAHRQIARLPAGTARRDLAAVVVPLGWFGGWLLKQVVTQLIPGPLRAFPIAALLWSGALLGLLIILIYDPAPTFDQMVLTPWLCLQVAAAPAAAGVYGVAEGWLAVDGSDQWWPLTPPKRPLSAEDAAAILGGYDITGPGLLDAQRLHQPGDGPGREREIPVGWSE